jgi:hypothetical protein
VKSYWEERVFDRDTRRLLAYYKHALPGSMSDGDLHNSRYVFGSTATRRKSCGGVLRRNMGLQSCKKMNGQMKSRETIRKTRRKLKILMKLKRKTPPTIAAVRNKTFR